MNILLIAGHGEGDPGACYFGRKESDLTRDLLSVLAPLLKGYANVTCYPTEKNCYKQNKAGNAPDWSLYDYVVELHFNAFSSHEANGTEIYVHKTEKGVTVEEKILREMETLGFKNRGIVRKTGLKNMNTCKAAGVSYALIETCFMSNATDIDRYIYNRERTAQAIANGIIKGFNLKIANTPTPADRKYYRVQTGAYQLRANAESFANLLKSRGIDCFVVDVGGDCPYKVQCGAFEIKANATRYAKELKAKGINCFVTES